MEFEGFRWSVQQWRGGNVDRGELQFSSKKAIFRFELFVSELGLDFEFVGSL